MLALVGTGLGARDISVRALEFLKSSDIILLESYTSISTSGAIDFIANETGKKLERTKRSDFEENVRRTVSRAKDNTVAIVVIGDPLIATTHHIILDEAARQGVETKVFHAPSVFSAAIGESRLDIYRFGPTVTIPLWSQKYKPVSFIDSINRNLRSNQHTLVLLDIKQPEGNPMSITEAYETLKAASAQMGDATIIGRDVMVIGNVGRDDKQIFRINASKLESLSGKLEGSVICIIVPADLNFAEEEAIKGLP